MKGFGERLRKLRDAGRLSQQDLAQMTGIHLGQISRYERGIILPSAETAVLLCRALRVSADVLLFGDRSKEAPAEIENLRLIERFRRLAEMDRAQQEVAIKLIDALVAQREVERIVARRPLSSR